MGGEALAEGKDGEVRNLATKYGVDRYLGTEKLAIVDVLVKTWADDVSNDDPLTRSTKWLEAKSEIEDVLADVAISSNTRETMYLLGGAATGKVSLEEVRAAFTNGWNTLMRQYSSIIGAMSQESIVELERNRERFLSTMPLYGTIEEKRMMADAATQALRQVEALLTSIGTEAHVDKTRIDLGQKETTRSMLLAQAEAGLKSGALTPMDYQQVQNLIGRGESLFKGQLSAIGQYGNDVPSLLSEMNRTLTRASDVLGRQEHKYAMAGLGFITEPKMNELRQARGRVGSTGDGIHAPTAQNRVLNTIPVIVGQDVRQGNGGYPPWVAANQAPPEPTIYLNQDVSQMKFMNPADVHRNEPLESRFSAYHRQSGSFKFQPKGQRPLSGMSPAIAAKNGTGLGAAAADKLVNPWVQGVVIVGSILALPGIIRAIRDTKKNKKSETKEKVAPFEFVDPIPKMSSEAYEDIMDRWVRKIPKD